ncbi:MAG: 3-phosphoshikimate 1-carboxyvinyltransferase [Candidatus Promineifilaceae bacterium]
MARKLRVYPQTTPLNGTITVPGDKSVSHRSIMLGSLAEGVSHVRRWLPAGDPRATLGIFRQLGVQIDVVESSPTAWDLTIHGVGLHGLQPSDEPLDSRNAGTCIRLLAGIMAGQRFPSVLDGSDQLRARPMARVTIPLADMGANIRSTDGKAPMHVEPTPLNGISYTLPVASAQIKSCVLLAGLYANGTTQVIEPGPGRDHTERMLKAMGVDVTVDENVITITPPQSPLQPLDLVVPADISSAAFPIVAAAIVPHSEITIENCGQNETRTGILEMLATLGAEFSLTNERITGGEPAADVTVNFSEMHGATISGPVVVRGIDEFPVLAVALSQAMGRSVVTDAAELRVKEVDRISMTARELGKMGVVMNEHPDGFEIEGPMRLHGAEVDSHDDHRLGMMLSIAGLIADSPTTISEANCIADSFPGFVETMQQLGARMEWLDE